MRTPGVVAARRGPCARLNGSSAAGEPARRIRGILVRSSVGHCRVGPAIFHRGHLGRFGREGLGSGGFWHEKRWEQSVNLRNVCETAG